MSLPAPFDFPPVVMAPLQRSEFLDMLRLQINPSYMPSDFTTEPLRSERFVSRPRHNKKPDYWPDDERYIDSSTQSEFFTHVAHAGWPGFFVWPRLRSTPMDEIHAMINLTGFSLIVGLRSLAVRIFLTGENNCTPAPLWIRWDNEEDTVNVDRIDLSEKINYL